MSTENTAKTESNDIPENLKPLTDKRDALIEELMKNQNEIKAIYPDSSLIVLGLIDLGKNSLLSTTLNGKGSVIINSFTKAIEHNKHCADLFLQYVLK